MDGRQQKFDWETYISSMIWCCPFCGFKLKKPVLHGISSCTNCCRVFDTSDTNRLLSAAWLVKRDNICSEEALMQYGFSHAESKFVIEAIVDSCLLPEELAKLLKENGIPQFESIC